MAALIEPFGRRHDHVPGSQGGADGSDVARLVGEPERLFARRGGFVGAGGEHEGLGKARKQAGPGRGVAGTRRRFLAKPADDNGDPGLRPRVHDERRLGQQVWPGDVPGQLGRL